MRRNLLLLIFGAATALLLWSQRSRATAVEYNEADDVQTPSNDPSYWVYSSDANTVENINMGSPENNLLAFLALIRKFESNDRYDVMYGGKTFNDYSQHPNVAVPINLPGYEGKVSTAAGAYQFIFKTWRNLASRLSLTDFSPASQDAAAVELLSEIGAMPAIQAGDFDNALRLASSQWASLPYSAAKQSPQSIAAANEFLTRYLQNVA